MYFPFYGLILSNDRMCVRAIIHGWLMRYLLLELLERGGGGVSGRGTPPITLVKERGARGEGVLL
jgi:hypothetical protein